MAFGAFRTIWITLRAVNYTTRAFQDTARGLTKLQRQQLRFRLNAARNIMAVGMMYVAMGMMAALTIGRIIRLSRYGTRMMDRFGKRINRSLAKLGTAFAKVVKPILDVVASILEIVTAHPVLLQTVSLLSVVATTILIAEGAAKIFAGTLIFQTAKQWAANMAMQASLPLAYKYAEGVTVAGTATAYFAKTLTWVHKYAMPMLIVFTMLLPIFQGLPKAIMAVVAALIVLAAIVAYFKGPAALADLAVAAGVGAGLAGIAAATAPEYQMGTTFVRKGGVAVVHGGEEIRSARETRVPSLIERKGPSKRIYNIRFDIGHLHTKADKEEMVDVIRKAMRSVT